MDFKNLSRKWILAFSILVWVAACVPTPQPTEAPVGTPTPTPDPLYSIHCILHTGRYDFCYAGQGLIGNTELLQKATKEFCETVAALANEGWCMVYVWEDEASVAKSWPLSSADKNTLIASYTVQSFVMMECFTAYDHGEVTFRSGTCKK